MLEGKEKEEILGLYVFIDESLYHSLVKCQSTTVLSISSRIHGNIKLGNYYAGKHLEIKDTCIWS